jgi:hypothetical protein
MRICTDPDIKKLDQKDVRQNVRRAERAHVTFDELHLKAPHFMPDDETREAIESGLDRWKAGRQGKQIAAVSSDRFRYYSRLLHRTVLTRINFAGWTLALAGLSTPTILHRSGRAQGEYPSSELFSSARDDRFSIIVSRRKLSLSASWPLSLTNLTKSNMPSLS